MAKLEWDAIGEHYFQAGVDRGVLYPAVGPGIAWNGLISVKEAPTDGGSDMNYFDGIPYRRDRSSEGFAATLSAFSYPPEFEEYDGTKIIATQQRRKSFGLSYRTRIGNDVEGVDHGYQIHLVYNALASPSDRDYDTIDDSSQLTPFSWDLTTTPIPIPGAKMSSHLIIDTRKAYSWTVEALEYVLYGNPDSYGVLPAPADVIELFDSNSIVKVVDNGDGTFTVSGPDDIVSMIDLKTFQISWDSAVYIDENTYRLSSL